MRSVALTAAWLTATLALVRWWELTLRYPGLLLWTAVFIVTFLGVAFARFGRAIASQRRAVWAPLHRWTGLLVAVYALYLLFPTFRIQGMTVSSAAIVGVVDLAVPLWILARGLGLVWEPPARLIVVGVLIPVLLATAYWYMIPMPGTPFRGHPPPLDASERDLRTRLEHHVRVLATEIGERNYAKKEALDAAAAYVRDVLQGAGYPVVGYPYRIGAASFEILEATISGAERPEEIVVIGGHYDSVEGAPGANDNATGVAALLELARVFAAERPARTVRFVAFPNEEPPFFQTSLMGSRVYAARAEEGGERIVAMLSLETIGYYSDEPGSQRYPFPFNLFYPDRGDFIGFVANLGSRRLVRESIAVFREVATIPSHGAASPGWIPGINWSDHASFWLHGYEAIMITDTAPFRYPYYHTALDVADQLDFERMTRVVTGLVSVVRHLAGSG